MDKTQTLVVVLLVVAIVFSAVSMIAVFSLSLSSEDYRPVKTINYIQKGSSSGDDGSAVALVIEPNSINGGVN